MASYFNSHYTLGFNYRPSIEPMIISNQTVITNPHTAPELFGSFLEVTPTCGINPMLTEIRNWIGTSNGRLCQFSVFDQAPILAAKYKLTAHIADALGNIELRTWVDPGSGFVRQPYVLKCAVPISTTTAGLTVASNRISGSFTIGQEITCKFGFWVVPENNYFEYSRVNIKEIPFKIVPVGGFGYVNNA